jgi:F-type H+-transporting ATPase subunit b
MPQFDPSTYSSQIFWFFVCFCFLVFFIKNKLIPKIDAIFENRYFKLQAEKKKIDDLIKEIEGIKVQNQKQIEQAHEDVENLIEKTRKEINQDKDLKVQRLNLEIQAHMTEFDNQLKWQMQEAKHRYEDDLKSYLKELQVKIVPPSS